jgi:hypothetical protein
LKRFAAGGGEGRFQVFGKVKNPLHLLPISSKCCAIKVSKDAGL